jgi:thiol-disulfide isomerase/thioredoxin
VPAFEVDALRDSTSAFEPADFQGRYLLINLWAAWCGPCIEKVPVLQDVRARYDDRTLAILNVAFDGARAESEKVLQTHDMPGRHAFAGSAALGESFGTSFATVDPDDPTTVGLPNATLVAPDGEVLARLRPPADGLREALSEHLPQKPQGNKK